MATLWDQFDSLLRKAEEMFWDFRFDEALSQWESYYKITAKSEYGQIIREIRLLLREWNADKISSADQLHTAFRKVRQRYQERQIHRYTYELFLNLFKRIYSLKFAELNTTDYLFHGIFNYLLNNHELAIAQLKNYLAQNIESVEGRIFLGYTYLEMGMQKKTIALLTENLFLAADQLAEDDLYLSQFKLLMGRLFSKIGRKNASAWLLPFEAWYRNYLVFEENEQFYKLMRQKEQNERIIRVKYTMAERYRHFARCLFVAEYTRRFGKKQPRIIMEQEVYMEQLDPALFARYRRKRKPVQV